ncbi:MAG: gamma-butyrobetaine hydroxylase-like domain-containing protein [Candidatus Limnocylindrales bacterium]
MSTSYTAGGEYLTPRRVHADRAGGRLEIDWGDGHRTVYDFVTLRWLCPCAYCRGEAGQPGWLDSAPTLTPAQTQLTNLHLVGQYALAPTWADGHHTGYYTFERLREACPCPDDSARRAAAPHAGHGPEGAP